MTAALAAFREHDVVDLPNAFRGTVLSTEGTTARIATIGSPTTTLWRFADLRLYHRPAPFVEVQVPPTATQEIAAAIDELAKLKARSTPGPWFLTYESANHPRVWGNADDIDADHVATTARNPRDAELTVTLHRTIDAQLAILEGCLAADLEGYALALARAINGTS